MAHRVCPWWMGYLLVSPIRRLGQDPRRILGPLVSAGMTVLEPGSGMGFFTLDLARLVGPGGRVVAVDVQPRMLAGLERRATRAGLADRIDMRLAKGTDLGTGDLDGRVDFALAFALVHELPDQDLFFEQLHRALKPGGVVLLAEPRGHVGAQDFAASIASAVKAGFHSGERPAIRSSHAITLRRG